MSGRKAIAIVGAGAFGTALAIVAAKAGPSGMRQPVILFGRNAEAMDRLGARRINDAYLPQAELPDDINCTSDPRALSEAGIVLFAVPSKAIRAAAEGLSNRIAGSAHVVVCAKGFERQSGAFLADVLVGALPGRQVAVLSGPGFAADIAGGLPTAMTLAGKRLAVAEALAASLSRPTFRLYASDDAVGVQIGGAVKNVLAIGAGIVDGAGLGESARAALIARGLAELSRLVERCGGRAETASGLSGLGDLVLTATSRQSRNLRYGIEIGRGRRPEALTGDKTLVEGALAAPVTAAMAERLGVAMPITDAVSQIVAGRIGIAEALRTLMSRPLKTEGG